MVHTGGIVLCGGRSSRMGRAKAWLPVGGETMLHRVTRVIAEVVSPVVVVAAPGQDVPPLPAGVRVVRDEVEGRGPLGGLAAGLAAVAGECDRVYLSGCDVPLLRAAFVRVVVQDLIPLSMHGERGVQQAQASGLPRPGGERAGDGLPSGSRQTINASPLNTPLSMHGEGGRGGEVLSIPLIANRLHPLAACYPTSILPLVLSQLAADDLGLTRLTELFPTHLLTEADFATADPHLESLRNVNTPSDYDALPRG